MSSSPYRRPRRRRYADNVSVVSFRGSRGRKGQHYVLFHSRPLACYSTFQRADRAAKKVSSHVTQEPHMSRAMASYTRPNPLSTTEMLVGLAVGVAVIGIGGILLYQKYGMPGSSSSQSALTGSYAANGTTPGSLAMTDASGVQYLNTGYSDGFGNPIVTSAGSTTAYSLSGNTVQSYSGPLPPGLS